MNLKEIRTKLKRAVSLAESRNPFRIAFAKRYIVQSRDDLPPGTMGAFIRVGVHGGVIYYRSELREYALRYIISHEVAHGILGHSGTSLTTEDDYRSFNWISSLRIEQEAHLCAACLLLDDREFSSDDNLPNLVNETGVPYKIIEKWHLLNYKK